MCCSRPVRGCQRCAEVRYECRSLKLGDVSTPRECPRAPKQRVPTLSRIDVAARRQRCKFLTNRGQFQVRSIHGLAFLLSK